MKLNLNCFYPPSSIGDAQESTADVSSKPSKALVPPLVFNSEEPLHKVHEAKGIPVGFSTIEKCSTGIPTQFLTSQLGCSPRIPISSSFQSKSPLLGHIKNDLSGKIRSLGEMLRTIEAKAKPVESAFGSLSARRLSSIAAQDDTRYRRNWLDTDFPALRDTMYDSSLRSTPRNPEVCNRKTFPGFDLQAQLSKLENMLRVDDKPSHRESGASSQQLMEMKLPEYAKTQNRNSSVDGSLNLQAEVLRDLLIRVANVEDRSRTRANVVVHEGRLAMKKDNCGLEEQMKSFASSLTYQLERNAAAVKSLEKKLQKLVCQQKEKKQTKCNVSPCSAFKRDRDRNCYCSSRKAVDFKAANEFSDSTMASLEKEVSSFNSKIRHVMSTTDDLRKQCDENSMDAKLSWSAIDQLCIDNEAFRREIQQQKAFLKKQQENLTIDTQQKMKDYASVPNTKDEVVDASLVSDDLSWKESHCGRWSCTSTLQ